MIGTFKNNIVFIVRYVIQEVECFELFFSSNFVLYSKVGLIVLKLILYILRRCPALITLNSL